jgi:enoyl-CoA hydratase/carnithine racemase
MPEINFGFVPGGQIVKSVGIMASHRALSYLALTGRLISADQARQWGLVTHVVDGTPLDHALQLARDWVTGPAMPQ